MMSKPEPKDDDLCDRDIVAVRGSQMNEHDDFFVNFVKAYYFPFVKKFCKFICAGWLAVFIICVAFGPKFLSNTRSDLDVPKGTPSAAANDALDINYPTMSPWPPVFIVLHSNVDSGVVGAFSRNIDSDLASYVASNSDSIDQKVGYYDYVKNPSLSFLESSSLSEDNKTMVLTVSFKKSASLAMVQTQALNLLSFASKRTTKDISVGCTGLQALYAELSDACAKDTETLESIVLPIAIIILGYNVRSYRHMLIALCTLACTVLLAFAIMVPISDALAINPFSPSIMLSLVSLI
jgi:uncharacterized membrane protein YdfJ with MMPL/SSD domain